MNRSVESNCGSSLVEASRVVQLRAVFWSMRKVIAAAQREAGSAKALLFELHALAEAGVSLADCAIDEVEG